MRLDSLRDRLSACGARPAHQRWFLQTWLQALPDDHGRHRPEDFLPLALREQLPQLRAELDALAVLVERHPDAEGAERLLVRLADGQMIESVLLPRGGLCVSSQVGCAVGCVFCMTGRDGLQRQLSVLEILAQVALARRLRPVRKVVFMGMGEPAHNLEHVIEAIERLAQEGGIGHKNLVFSTVGDRRVFERLAVAPIKPALALSLHSTRASLREQLLPSAARIDPADLVAMADDYCRATGYPIQYQWTLLAGINDGEEEVEGIARLLAGRYAVMNLIPWNQVSGLPYRRPDPERAISMARELHQRGVLTKLRQSAGQSVEGGCGQLRARAQPLRRLVKV